MTAIEALALAQLHFRLVDADRLLAEAEAAAEAAEETVLLHCGPPDYDEGPLRHWRACDAELLRRRAVRDKLARLLEEIHGRPAPEAPVGAVIDPPISPAAKRAARWSTRVAARKVGIRPATMATLGDRGLRDGRAVEVSRGARRHLRWRPDGLQDWVRLCTQTA